MKFFKHLSLFFLLGISQYMFPAEQEQKISIRFNNIPLQEAIKRVEKVSSYTFFYDPDKTELKQEVSLAANEMSVRDVVKALFSNTDLDYEITNTQIALFPRTAPIINQSQRKLITGTVTDDTGETIIGANIVEKGTQNGVISDHEGRFSLEIANKAILVVSYIGFTRKEIQTGSQNMYTIVLEEESTMLSDVVVVGYGTQKKATLTGAIAAISNKDIITTKNENVQNMLSGKIAGVKVTQKSSEPGSFNNDFQIRGMGAPLIVVDGVARDNFTRLNANEVESISILKDASAAIYGVRAANGVVLITTKKGAKGSAFRLDYTGTVGFQNMINQPQPLDAIGFMQLQNEKTFNGGSLTPAYPQSSFEPYLNGTLESTDWQSGTIRNQAPQTEHSFSASGGTDKMTYFFNFGYLDQAGFWKSGDLSYERFNLRSNVTAELAKGLRMEALVNMMKDTKDQPSTWDTWNLFKGFWTQIPLNPYYANDNPDYPFFAADGLHPEYMTDASKSGYRKRTQRLVQTNLALEWDIPGVKGLKARGMYSYDYKENEDKIFRKTFNLYTYDSENDKYNATAVNSPSQLTRRTYKYETKQLQLSLSYNKTFNALHNVSGLLLYEENDRDADNFYARRDYSMDAVDHLFAGNSTNQVGSMDMGTDNTNGNTEHIYNYTNKALVGRFNYDYASKYLAEFSFRYDGSSKFASGHQWGFFPSGSVGWRMSEETFIKDNEALNFISNWKWRVSYGLMGDDNASNYQFVSGYTYPSGGYVFGGDYINAFGVRGMTNPNITWFKAAVINIGIDAEFWHGLLGVTYDMFQRDRSNLLATRAQSLPGLVGAALPQENLESDLTRGFELTLTHRNQIGKDFRYNISGNMAMARTKWKYKEIARQGNSYENWRNNYNDRWNDIWWGWNNTGRFKSYEDIFANGIVYNGSKGNSMMLPGDLIYEDWNGDGIIDENDIHAIGINSSIDRSNNNGGMPILNYGFTIGAEYKGFDLNLVIQGAAMSWLRYPEQLEMPLPWNRNGLDMFLDRWHRADQFDPASEWIPGHFPSTYRDNGREGFIIPSSTFWMQNASYLRLKSLEFGYTIPSNLTKVVGVQNARVFFSSYNLFTITGLTYCDPEHTGDEYGYTYPLSQTFNFGVNISF